MRAYVSRRWPRETPAAWDRALAEPDLDLVHRFDGDRVLTWHRRHGESIEGSPRRELTDQLNVRVYATMLATLIARRSTADSLSIGLFGEWGSGKTTFMELIQQEVERLTAIAATDPVRSDYVTDVVPIWFNAWHYADANLWASLAAELFDQLLGPRPDLTEERRDELRTELERGQRRAEELRSASKSAQQRAGELRAQLVDAERRRVARRGRFDAEVLRNVSQDPALRPELEKAARAAGLDRAHLVPVTQLARDVAATADDLEAIRTVLRRRRWTWTFTATLAFLLFLAGALAFSGEVREALQGLSVASVAVVLGQIGWAVRGARAALAPLRAAAEKADEIEERVVEATTEAHETLAGDVIAAEGEAAALAAQLDETLANVAALEGQLQDLTPGSRLYSFIAARAASNDYRSQLGVVSTIRRDFDHLSGLMDDWRRQKRDGGADGTEAKRPIDRVVLYIDDLDRCEPEQVVAVLQAVNLLVAMDLFIVIVGVDPRWLLRSLRNRYDRLLGTDDTERGDLSFREATPQNYLEKIFQVPFVLPGLGTDGVGRLFRSLVAADRPVTDPPRPAEQWHPIDGDEPQAPTDVRAPDRHGSVPLPVEEASQVATINIAPETVTVTRDITEPELALLARLHELVRTPRSAKRLLNIYRLLRSTRDLRPAARFLGSDGQPGEYQAVVILLAVLTAYPELLGQMLWGQRSVDADDSRGLCNGGGSAGWRAFVSDLRPRPNEPATEADDSLTTDDRPVSTQPVASAWCNDVCATIDETDRAAWVELVDALQELIGGAEQPAVTLDDIEPFRLWGPRVARFSFVLSAFAS